MILFLSGALENWPLPGSRRKSNRKRRKDSRERHIQYGVAPWLVGSPARVKRFLECREEFKPDLIYELGAFILALPLWWQFLNQLDIVSDRETEELLSAIPNLVSDLAERMIQDIDDPIPPREIAAMLDAYRGAAESGQLIGRGESLGHRAAIDVDAAGRGLAVG